MRRISDKIEPPFVVISDQALPFASKFADILLIRAVLVWR
jgi:hypothetical protein